MRRYFSKYQWMMILLSLLSTLYFVYFYFQNRELERAGVASFHTITKQTCARYKGHSSLDIIVKGKRYLIRLANQECTKYPVGSRIKLIYHAEYDYFYIPDGLKRDKTRVLISVIFLGFCLLPWGVAKYYMTRYNVSRGSKHRFK